MTSGRALQDVQEGRTLQLHATFDANGNVSGLFPRFGNTEESQEMKRLVLTNVGSTILHWETGRRIYEETPSKELEVERLTHFLQIKPLHQWGQPRYNNNSFLNFTRFSLVMNPKKSIIPAPPLDAVARSSSSTWIEERDRQILGATTRIRQGIQSITTMIETRQQRARALSTEEPIDVKVPTFDLLTLQSESGEEYTPSSLKSPESPVRSPLTRPVTAVLTPIVLAIPPREMQPAPSAPEPAPAPSPEPPAASETAAKDKDKDKDDKVIFSILNFCQEETGPEIGDQPVDAKAVVDLYEDLPDAIPSQVDTKTKVDLHRYDTCQTTTRQPPISTPLPAIPITGIPLRRGVTGGVKTKVTKVKDDKSKDDKPKDDKQKRSFDFNLFNSLDPKAEEEDPQPNDPARDRRQSPDRKDSASAFTSGHATRDEGLSEPETKGLQLMMFRQKTIGDDGLQVSIVTNNSLQTVPLLVDTGGSVSIAGSVCAGMFESSSIFSTDPMVVATASGTMVLEYAWRGNLDLAGARITTTLLLAPLYMGGIIFGTDIQRELGVSIHNSPNSRLIYFGCLGVVARTCSGVTLTRPIRSCSMSEINIIMDDLDRLKRQTLLLLDEASIDLDFKVTDFKIKRSKTAEKSEQTSRLTLGEPASTRVSSSLGSRAVVTFEEVGQSSTLGDRTASTTPVGGRSELEALIPHKLRKNPVSPTIGTRWNEVILTIWRTYLEKFPVLGLPEGEGPQVTELARIQVKPGPPICVPNYRSALAEREFIGTKVADLLSKKIIKKAVSEWNSPILVVPKPGDEKWRLVIDYRRLNKRIAGDTFPLPHIEDLLTKTARATIFSKIDLVSGFHQIPVHPHDQHYLAFTAIDESYTYCYVPFGLNIAPAIFTRALSRALLKCDSFTAVYVDDILVFSQNVEAHMQHLAKVFNALGEANFRISMKKSILGVEEIEYLGHILTPGQVHQHPKKKEAVANFPEPQSAKAVRRFIGMTGYYRKFIKGFAKIANPLMELVSLKGRIKLNEEQVKSFNTLKNALVQAPLLELFRSDRETRIEVDSCAVGVGAVLSQAIDGVWKPVAYFSKKFPQTVKAYASREAEAYGIYLTVLHWRVWLLGKKFTIISDHESLVLSDHGRNSRRIQRWLLGLSEYKYDIKYRRGIMHSVPDALSRAWSDDLDELPRIDPTIAWKPTEGIFVGEVTQELSAEDDSELGLDTVDADEDEDPPEVVPLEEYMNTLPSKEEWAKATMRCPELAPIARVLTHELNDNVTAKVQAKKLIDKYQLVLVDGVIVDGKGIKWVPEEYRDVMCSLFHATPFSFHHDAKRTTALLTAVVTWPFVEEHVKAHVTSCLPCRMVKGKVFKPILQVRDVEPVPFQVVAIDHAGPFPLTSSKKEYILVCVDMFSGYPEAVAVPSLEAAQTVKALLPIFARHGWPKVIISDNGTSFRNALLRELCRHTGMKQHFTTTRHPQSNGAAENLVKAIKTALKLDNLQRSDKMWKNWDQRLDMVLFALRRAPRAPLWLSPAQIIYGRQIEGPVERRINDEEIEYAPVKDWIFQRLQAYHETRYLLDEVLSAARQERSDSRVGQMVQTLKSGDFVLIHHPKYQISENRGAKLRWKGPYVVYKATSAVNYIVLVEGKPTVIHVSRLLPYDPTGVKPQSPLRLRLEQLKKELQAYETLVQAEIKSLQSRRKRVVPELPLPTLEELQPPASSSGEIDLELYPQVSDDPIFNMVAGVYRLGHGTEDDLCRVGIPGKSRCRPMLMTCYRERTLVAVT